MKITKDKLVMQKGNKTRFSPIFIQQLFRANFIEQGNNLGSK